MWKNFPGSFAVPELSAQSRCLVRLSGWSGVLSRHSTDGSSLRWVCRPSAEEAWPRRLFLSRFWNPHPLLTRPLMELSVGINAQGLLGTVLDSLTIWPLSLTGAGGRAARQFLKGTQETSVSSPASHCWSRSLPIPPRCWGRAMEGKSPVPVGGQCLCPICKSPVCHTQPPRALWQLRKEVVHVVSLQIKRSLCGFYH